MISFGLRVAVLVSLLAATAICFSPRPTVDVVSLGQEAAPRPIESLDHARWTELLGRYVDEDGAVDYAAWQACESDRRQLDDYLRQLSAAYGVDRADREVRLAFWINAYNAVTVAGILREYPTSSIRNHTPRLLGYNIWRDLYLTVDGRRRSLEDIEHRILRPLGEPRIHFAIVCASKGCPRLRREAYTPAQLDAQLADNARAFFADATKCAVDARRKSLGISPILQWFARDFGADEAARLQTIRPWLPADAAAMIDSGEVAVRYLDYDWRLNDRVR